MQLKWPKIEVSTIVFSLFAVRDIRNNKLVFTLMVTPRNCMIFRSTS